MCFRCLPHSDVFDIYNVHRIRGDEFTKLTGMLQCHTYVNYVDNANTVSLLVSKRRSKPFQLHTIYLNVNNKTSLNYH